MSIKLKDFKDKPEQYQEILDICRRKGIPVDDESDISELIGKINAFKNGVNSISNGVNSLRQAVPGQITGSREYSIVDIIAAGSKRR